MKYIISIFCIAASVLMMQAQVKETLLSPNGKVKMEIIANNELTFNIFDNGKQLLKGMPNLLIEGKKASLYTGASAKSVEEHFDAPNYKMASFDDAYNALIVKNKNGVNVEFRAYNSGVAYRFVTTSTKGEWTVKDEVTSFDFAGDYTAYLPYSTNPQKPMAMAFQATYDVAPLSKSRNLEAFLPATFDEGTTKITLLETDVEAYPGMFVKAKGTTLKASFPHYPKTFDYYPWRQQKYVTATEDFIAKGKGNRTFPWRVLVITHDDTEMPTNTLAYQLGSPSRIQGDTSWIRPGKVAWDWWNDWGLTGVPFEAGINQDTYKYYIDFAAKNGLEYIILDEGWYNPKSGDMLTVIPELDLPELVRYGQQKQVGIILWTVFNVLDTQLEKACEQYAKMGIKGFKVDFMDRYDQEAVEMIERIAEKCAQHHLMLDYHGIFAPQGITRTYPNVINFEAVFGMEEVKWTERAKFQQDGKTVDAPSKDMPAYDVTFPFIRGMVGPVDFTPGGMRNASKADFQPIYNNPMTMGTRCHQLAHYIVHESPLTMLADNPSAYEKEAECTAFIASLPTVYDEMRVLSGKMGEYLVVARRKGNDWYVAGETNWNSRDVEIRASFLPAGTYVLTAFMDGLNADKNATDYSVWKQQFTLPFSTDKSVKVHMASGGGFAAKLIKQ
ncbi:MAG: glycoside hydrolase family 97 protein [Bacteroidaceae bacterium]|nr:glycoside hydrolase family 97 protein [Bacteroidaceae bacterium]